MTDARFDLQRLSKDYIKLNLRDFVNFTRRSPKFAKEYLSGDWVFSGGVNLLSKWRGNVGYKEPESIKQGV